MRKNFTFLLLVVLGFTASMSAQWTAQTSPTTGKLEALWFMDANTGFMSGGFVQKLYKTTDGGVTWTGFSNYPVRELQFVNATTGYASSHVASAVGTMQKTVNGGTTFTGITPPNSSSYLGVYAVSPTTAFFINTENKVLKTTNAGASVTSYTLGVAGSGNQVTDIHFSDANTGYICTVTGNIFKTTNAGNTWAQISTGVSAVGSTSIHFVNPSVGYIGGSKIIKTTDGGATWVDKSVPGNSYTQAIKFYDENNGISVGLSGRIYRTSDGGTTWIQQASGTTEHLRNVFYLDANTAVAVGDNGTILRNSAVLSSPGVEAEDAHFTFYPNPVTDESMLSVSNMLSTAGLTMEVYNLSGQLVREEKITSSEYTFQKGSLQAGIYILKIKDSGTVLETLKIAVE